MQSCRWALALVITLMLIDSWLKRAEAGSTEPTRSVASSRCTGHPIVSLPMDSR
jgi:hypothetical protein